MVCKAQDGISNSTVVIMAGVALLVWRLTVCWTVLGSNPGGRERFSLFHSHPERPEPAQHPAHWVLRLFPGGKGAGVWH
jgi:Na+-transporting NADH:ubiquinone oxidoreductase subunit NqrB